MTRVKPELRDKVMALWNAGKTAGQIGAELGITRNAAIGIVTRFKGTKRTTRTPHLHCHNSGKRFPRAPKPEKAVPSLPAIATNPVPVLIPGNNCGIVDITDGCKWPVSTDASVIGGYLFCNADKGNPEKPYCAYHASLAGAAYSAKLITHTIAQARHAYKGQR